MAGLAWRARRGRDLIPGPPALGATEAGRARFYALVPFILGIHVGLPLIWYEAEADIVRHAIRSSLACSLYRLGSTA
jgi:hypothetical protein